ncbi:hypothetical protein V2J09_010340 [Rumex salicifolius]
MRETKVKTSTSLFFVFLLCCSHDSTATKIKAGYWLTVSEFPIQDIKASLFTHIICGFASINATTFKLSVPISEIQYFSSFTSTVKQNSPSTLTLLSIGDAKVAHIFFSMLSSSFHRQSFVNSSIQMARSYGFDGIDLFCLYSKPLTNITAATVDQLGSLFDEWKIAVDLEAQRLNKTRLILTTAVYYSPSVNGGINFPVESMQRSFDWVNLLTFDYYTPTRDASNTHFHAALYDPLSDVNTDFGIKKWIKSGLSKGKIVMGLPYHGYAWTLSDKSKSTSVGSPASGLAITADGSMSYRYIKQYVRSSGAMVYNSTYVENYWTFGSFWVCFDDVVAIKTKVSYVLDNGLLGYFVFQVANDDSWKLSQAASDQMEGKNGHQKKRLVVVVALICVALLFLTIMLYFRGKLLRNFRSTRKGTMISFSSDSHDLKAFSYADIREATNNFTSENKLGEGGYGPVYKGKLKNGQEIAVKQLSKTSTQGYEEFKNEVTLTASLQHINLVKVLGFCMDRDEQMLIYEYLPNKSLDLYLFDPVKRQALDWNKLAEIVQGIIQGLVYLQEYSRLTIIHRDLKASNILLDEQFRPKISDFGMARIFQKDEHEANTDRIVGTYGYVPPEYVNQGIYSTKYDVYSFGVMLLQIITGKRNNRLYGDNENLNLLDYAYEMWREGRANELMDPGLDDSYSDCKLERCLQTALLCVQKKQEDRPSMLEVWSMLRNQSETMATPKRPAFSVTKDDAGNEDGESVYVSRHRMCSAHMSSVSEIFPR